MSRRSLATRMLSDERLGTHPALTSRRRVPAAPWRARVVEVFRMASWHSDRLTTTVLWFTLALPIGLLGLVGGREQWPAAGLASVLGVGATYAVARLADERHLERTQLREVWSGPAMATQAARYRLDAAEEPEVPVALADARLLRPPFRWRGGVLPIGQRTGTVRGREASVLGLMSERGELERWLVALVRVRRTGSVRIRPAAWHGLGARQVESFAELFRAKGEGAAQLPTDLQTWLASTCRELEFELLSGWVLCRRSFPRSIDSADVGVLLAAVVGFADRWDGG